MTTRRSLLNEAPQLQDASVGSWGYGRRDGGGGVGGAENSGDDGESSAWAAMGGGGGGAASRSSRSGGFRRRLSSTSGGNTSGGHHSRHSLTGASSSVGSTSRRISGPGMMSRRSLAGQASRISRVSMAGAGEGGGRAGLGAGGGVSFAFRSSRVQVMPIYTSASWRKTHPAASLTGGMLYSSLVLPVPPKPPARKEDSRGKVRLTCRGYETQSALNILVVGFWSSMITINCLFGAS